jgi:hypothetical protein
VGVANADLTPLRCDRRVAAALSSWTPDTTFPESAFATASLFDRRSDCGAAVPLAGAASPLADSLPAVGGVSSIPTPIPTSLLCVSSKNQQNRSLPVYTDIVLLHTGIAVQFGMKPAPLSEACGHGGH